MIKETEKKKFRPGEIVKTMQGQGFKRFNMHHHTQLWKRKDAKNQACGFGVLVVDQWYWYERWVCEVEKHCEANRMDYV